MMELFSLCTNVLSRKDKQQQLIILKVSSCCCLPLYGIVYGIPNAVSMLAQRLRRWPNIETGLDEWLVFAGIGP